MANATLQTLNALPADFFIAVSLASIAAARHTKGK